MLDRQRTRRETREVTAVRVEDVIPAELLDGVGVEDRDYLEQVFREPQNYLPPRSHRMDPAHRADAARSAEPAEEPESRFARRAKQVGLVGAGALVAGAVVTAALLSGGPRPTTPVAEDTIPTGFSGAAALGGQAVPSPQEHGAGGTTFGHREGTSTESGDGTPQPTQNTGSATQHTGAPSTSVPSTTPATGDTEATGAVATSDADKLKAVKSFYSSIDKNPDNALALLAPGLAQGEAGSLVRAWSAARSIDVQDARVQDDGSVVAVAVLHQADGTLLRVTQLFDVVEHDVISEARLLSAVAFS
ncbi:hypothetical protein VSH64_41530 [Amycolatopsis rhabdoformis]|uniref:Nuclear transport factor 2 family protein n=1 Tax=Amycolatopsis rhabdoformis TaxID=1448059 RepID=A0ABZ1I4L9_9PSEU|nr:hypothetical protein [Amycolatopsis rhabdoformis]WSE29225.1 hypothetical protein VSH64_41530 [Amycolatopsis rhabdoformis]